MVTEEMIAALEEEGFTVIKNRDDPDTQLRGYWESAQNALRIAQDFVSSGARLHVTTPFPQLADDVIIGLVRSGMMRFMNNVLATAVVEREVTEAANAKVA